MVPAQSTKTIVWVKAEYGKSYMSIQKDGRHFYTGLTLVPWIMNCCGLAGLENFSNMSAALMHVTPGQVLKALWEMRALRSYTPWNYVYTLSDNQLDNPMHKVLKKCGAKRIGAPFENLAHGPNKLHIFRFNLKGAIGKYIDEQGNILPQPVKEKKNANSTNAQAV